MAVSEQEIIVLSEKNHGSRKKDNKKIVMGEKLGFALRLTKEKQKQK